MKMQGVCLTKDGELKLMESDIPEVNKNFVRIKVKKAGICASDIGYWKHGSDRLKNFPVVLGHEGCGIVDAVGPEVSSVKKGDRVIALTTFKICGKCRFCLNGSTNLCVEREGIGSKRNGVFADYVISPETSCLKIPDNLDFEEAVFAEPLSCCVHALMQHGNVNAQSKVLIIGPGPIGLLSALVAKANGATVVIAGLGSDEKRLKLAKELGMDYTVNLETDNLNEIINNISPYKMDICVEAAGNKNAFYTCMDSVANQGLILQMGVNKSQTNIDLDAVLHREIRIVGSLSQIHSSWPIACDLMQRGKINVKPLITQQFGLADFESAFETSTKSSSIKTLFDLSK